MSVLATPLTSHRDVFHWTLAYRHKIAVD